MVPSVTFNGVTFGVVLDVPGAGGAADGVVLTRRLDDPAKLVALASSSSVISVSVSSFMLVPLLWWRRLIADVLMMS